jgi:hypothetical protein
MIVRINQLDASRAEAESGWPPDGLTGPIRWGTPDDFILPVPPDATALEEGPSAEMGSPPAPAGVPGVRVFELLILEQDEQGRPLSETFRRAQLRQMLPQAIAALREPGEEVVLRLDGPLADGELLAAFRWLTDPDGRGRFAFSAAAKPDDAPQEVPCAVRVHPSPQLLTSLCGDMALGLERSVRLRAVCVPADGVKAVLEIDAADDVRWEVALARASFVLGSTRGLRSLQIATPRFDAAGVKSRVMRRLMSAAAGPAPQP